MLFSTKDLVNEFELIVLLASRDKTKALLETHVRVMKMFRKINITSVPFTRSIDVSASHAQVFRDILLWQEFEDKDQCVRLVGSGFRGTVSASFKPVSTTVETLTVHCKSGGSYTPVQLLEMAAADMIAMNILMIHNGSYRGNVQCVLEKTAMANASNFSRFGLHETAPLKVPQKYGRSISPCSVMWSSIA